MEIYVTVLLKSTLEFQEKYNVKPNEICYDKQHCAFICTLKIKKELLEEFKQDKNVLHFECAQLDPSYRNNSSKRILIIK
jgi:hypothetical protein